MKHFEIDTQTLEDLDIFSTYRNEESVFSLFDRTETVGGRDMLKHFMHNPLTSATQIRERIEVIAYLQRTDNYIRLSHDDLDFIEHYLRQDNYPTKFSKLRAIEKGISNLLKPTSEYYIISRGVKDCIRLLNYFFSYMASLYDEDCPEGIKKHYEKVEEKLSVKELQRVLSIRKDNLNALETEELDYYFRYIQQSAVEYLLQLIYTYDAYSAIAKTAAKLEFTYPEIVPNETHPVCINGLFHPFLSTPVKNSISFRQGENICFTTGANMSGKSTFLKAFGIAVYLSHLGFPVPASQMITPVYNGLITSINLADNLSQGYSHFYNEVLRIKNVAIKLQQTQRFVVIFDELFRGTNVKDAFDGTLAITSAFSNISHSLFIISTHITEVAEKLEGNKSILFRYFQSSLNKNDIPIYNYQLKEGTTHDRLGMYIINKERILDIINGNYTEPG